MKTICQHYVFTADGKIRGVVCNSDPDTMATCTEGYVSVQVDSLSPLYNTQEHYILNGQITERPASPVALTGLTLEHLPVGGDLFIDGTRYEITDMTVELEFPLPGTFNLRVERFPYLDWTGSVTV